jgi:hypothetical protein
MNFVIISIPGFIGNLNHCGKRPNKNDFINTTLNINVSVEKSLVMKIVT